MIAEWSLTSKAYAADACSNTRFGHAAGLGRKRLCRLPFERERNPQISDATERGCGHRSGFVDTFRKADTMSTMAETKSKRKRRSFTEEFKAGAVRLVLNESRSVPAVARDLDLTESSLRNWVEQAKTDAGRGKPGALTTAERDELTRLRRENRILQEEREILKKAAAFFANERR